MKKKRLTLNNVWKLCVDGLWKYVAKRKRAGDKRPVFELKRVWMNRHGYKDGEISADCFFCEYNAQHPGDEDCSNCPGKLVDNTFDCSNESYYYSDKPCDFLDELMRLNKIRKAK